MGHIETEIASQPDCWRRASALATAPGTDLPRPGERTAVIGCGTSWFMAMAYATLREQAGQGETDAFQASEFPAARRYDRVIAITRSGTTTEVLDLLAALPDDVPSTVIVGNPTSPAPGLAGSTVVMPFADERSVVQTRFATSALALLRGHLGADVAALARDAETAVTAALPVAPAGLDQITFLGRGWTVGLAMEAALKCREAASFWTEAYQAMDYRHGPIAVAAPGRAVWSLGELPEGLAEAVARTGATLVAGATLVDATTLVAGRSSDGPALDPMASLILVQRLAVALAAHRGLDPDAPRHLTRSVVLA